MNNKDKETQALTEAARKNFVGGFVDLHSFPSFNTRKDGRLEKVANEMFNAIHRLIMAHKERNK